MRTVFLALLSFALLVFVSCQKEVNEFDTTPVPVTDCLLTRMVEGIGNADDTVFLIRYDTLKRIKEVYDSSFNSVYTPTYTNGNKLPDKISFSSGGSTTMVYNSDSSIAEMTGWTGRHVFQYAAGGKLATSKTFVGDGNNGWRHIFSYKFYFTGDNLTKIEEYDNTDLLLETWEMTYTDILNPFLGLLPYNYENRLAMDDIFPGFEYMCNNKYLVKTLKEDGYFSEMTYKQNARGQVISSVQTVNNTVRNIVEYKVNRSYFYQCP